MCVPMAAAGLALTVASTAFGAYSAYQQGQAQSAQYKYQAAVARNNKIISDQNAQDSLARGKVEEDAHRLRVQQVKGSQRASFGASGVMVDSGSPLDILADTATMGELDSLTIRSNAQREARQHQIQGTNFAAEAGLLSTSARSASRAGAMNAFGTVLGGGSQFADRWYNYYRK